MSFLAQKCFYFKIDEISRKIILLIKVEDSVAKCLQVKTLIFIKCGVDKSMMSKQ